MSEWALTPNWDLGFRFIHRCSQSGPVPSLPSRVGSQAYGPVDPTDAAEELHTYEQTNTRVIDTRPLGSGSHLLPFCTQLGEQLCYGWLHINTHPTLCRLGRSPLCDQGIRDPSHSCSSWFINRKSFAIRLVSFAHVTSLFCLLDNDNFFHTFTAHYDTVMLRWVSVRFRAIQSFVLSRLLLQIDRGCNQDKANLLSRASPVS